MRVVISAPRKSGAPQLRCLIAMAYELKNPPVSAPDQVDKDSLTTWMAHLPEQSVATCDLSLELLSDPGAVADVRLIGVIRHPFDLFVSNYDVAQQQAARGREDGEEERICLPLQGEELDSEAARRYAASGFGAEVKALQAWASGGTSVRYEDLIADPSVVLRSLASALGPLSSEQIDRAIRLCPSENVVASRPGRGRRMPALPPGGWRDRLPASLTDTLRATFREEVARLGYDAS